VAMNKLLGSVRWTEPNRNC